jgi:hypothetical protein
MAAATAAAVSETFGLRGSAGRGALDRGRGAPVAPRTAAGSPGEPGEPHFFVGSIGGALALPWT